MPEHAMQIDSLPGSCPYLTKDNKGNIYLSWVRMMDDSSASFCYAVSDRWGKSFGKTLVIPSSSNIQPHSENLPKIIVKPSGEIMASVGRCESKSKKQIFRVSFLQAIIG